MGRGPVRGQDIRRVEGEEQRRRAGKVVTPERFGASWEKYGITRRASGYNPVRVLVSRRE